MQMTDLDICTLGEAADDCLWQQEFDTAASTDRGGEGTDREELGW